MSMAQRIVLSDDFDGSEATETVSFGLDGREYEVDLSDEHVAELRDFLKHYIDVGRRKGADGPRRRSTGAKRPDTPQPADDMPPSSIREWAAANGIQVNARGRIPAKVVEQYRQAAG